MSVTTIPLEKLSDMLVLTCEHGGNQVPPDYAPWFAGHETLLNSHRGWDPGALATAQHFAARLGVPLVHSEITRLLVDLNRSETNRALFSEVLQKVDAVGRAEILDRHYRPFRAQVLAAIDGQVRLGRFVRHLSFHSFTPIMRGEVRTAEIGLLYDPARAPERDLCRQWQAKLQAAFPEYRVRLNYPYRGTSDGHTAWLRRRFTAAQYAGIELEVNQALYDQPFAEVERLIARLAETFNVVVTLGGTPPAVHRGKARACVTG